MSSSKILARDPIRKRLAFLIPEGDEQPFRYALYNVALFVFLCVCLAAVVAVFLLFQAFLKPMAWAALMGTLIFPLKNTVSTSTKTWLRSLNESNTPLIIGIILLPFRLLDWAADRLWDLLTSEKARYLFIIYPFALFLAKYEAFSLIIIAAMKVIGVLDSIIGAFAGKWVVPLWLIYSITYIVWLWLQGTDAQDKAFSKALAIPVWFVAFCIIAQFFGPFKCVVFLALTTLVGLSEAGVIGANVEEPADEGGVTSSEEPEPFSSGAASNKPSGPDDEPKKGVHSVADLYIKWLLGACALLWFAKHISLLSFILIPMIYMVIKRAGSAIGLWESIGNAASSFFSGIKGKSAHVTHTAVPSSIRNLAKMIFSGDQAIINGLEQSMDVISSIIVMILVLCLVITVGFFLIFQLHSETVHLVELGTNVWNQTSDVNGSAAAGPIAKWAHDAVDGALGGQSLDSAVDEWYQYGRTWASGQVRAYAGDDMEKADMLEAQVKVLIDRLYELWIDRQKQSSSSIGADEEDRSVGDMISHLTSSFNLSAFKDDIVNLIKENMETLTSVLSSVWSVIQSNLSLVISVFTGLLGVVLSFGFELINLVVSTIVFLTVLYYLLAASRDQWKPLEWFSKLTPQSGSPSPEGYSDSSEAASVGSDGETSSPVTSAIEEAIKEVFILSIKKAVFYGAYTWFIHTLFDINVVFVPSVIAATLAAVPLTATYLICLPGIAELYLVRGQGILAVVFLILHIAPTLVIDSALIREVKGSHPYLTGLSIIGGMYWLGLSGAIIGPLVLCLCLVIFHVYRSLWVQDANFASSDVSHAVRTAASGARVR